MVSITLPLPPAALHAHAKGHWRDKTTATRRYREEAYFLALIAMKESCGEIPKAEANEPARGRLSVAFYWPDNRRRDTLNAIQGLKPAVDGIVDAGVLSDDSWQVLQIGEITAQIDRDKPRVEINVERLGLASAPSRDKVAR